MSFTNKGIAYCSTPVGRSDKSPSRMIDRDDAMVPAQRVHLLARCTKSGNPWIMTINGPCRWRHSES